MKYRKLGNTGLDVSILGYGASPLGSVFGPIDEPDGIRAVHTAFDNGVNLVDVSPYYGLTKAETVLGKAIKGVQRDRYLLATKVGRYGPNDFDFSAARIEKSIDESLARLGVDHVDFIQCHDIEFVTADQIINESIPTLKKIVKAGKARFIGITGLPLKMLATVAQQSLVDTVLSYCHYSLNDDALKDYLGHFEKLGMGIFSASPFSMGLLTHRELPSWHPAPPAVREACAKVAALCKQMGVDLNRLAIQFALEEIRIASTFVGMHSTADLLNNLAALEAPYDAERIAKIRELLTPIMNITWQSGRPENN